MNRALLLAIFAPMAFGVAPDPGPCDPVLIDLTTLIPQPEPPPQPECRSLVMAVAVGTDEAGQPTTLIRFLSPAGYAPVLAVLEPDSVLPAGTLDLGLASIDCLSASDDGLTVFVVSGGVLHTFAPVVNFGSFSLQLLSSVVVGPVDDVISRPGGAVVIGDGVTVIGGGTVIGTVFLDGDPIAGALLSDPTKLVVTLESGLIALVDLSTLSVVATKSIGPDLVGVAVCEPETAGGTDLIFVSDATTETITVVDSATMTVVDVVGAANPGRIETGETGPAGVDLALVMGQEFISVRDCDQDSPSYLEELAQIVLTGTPTTVVMGPAGTDLSTFVGTVDRKTVVVLDPDCITNAPRIDSISPAAGVPGTLVAVAGQFAVDTNFIVEIDGIPLVYATPLTLTATDATFEVPLGVAPGLVLTISATRSSEFAVIETGNYIRSSPRPFATLGVVAGIEALIAELQLASSGAPGPAKKKIDKAIEQLQKVLEQLAKGDIAEALAHFKEALEHLLAAIAKGGDVAAEARRLLEIVQSLLFQKIAALGPGTPLLADAQTLFDIGRGALLSGDLESALDAFADGLDELDAAVEVARPPGIDEARATAAAALDAVFDAVEILRWREPALALTPDQEKELDKIVAHLGPRPFGFEDTALEGYATGDFEAGGGHVKQAVKRLEDLIAEGVAVSDITKRLVKDFVELAKQCADAMAARVGPFDDVVLQMSELIAEAEANLNPNFLQGINSALGALALCPPPPVEPLPCDIAIEKLPVPPLLFGTGNTPPGPPYGGVPFAVDYALLKDPSATPGYFRLRVRDAGQVVAVLGQGLRLPGIYSTGWNGLGFSADPLTSLFSPNLPVLLAIPPGVYEMQYVYFCLMAPSGIHAVQSQFFSIVAEPPSAGGGPLDVTPSYVQFMAEQGGADPAAQTATISNLGAQTFEWSRTTDAAWLTSSPTGGTLAPGQSEELVVAPDTQALATGLFVGSLTISAATPNPGPVANSPQTVTAVLSVVPAGFVPEPGSGVPPGGDPGGPAPPPPGGSLPQASIADAPLSEAPTEPEASSAARCTVTATPRCENEPGKFITFEFTLPSDSGENPQDMHYLIVVDVQGPAEPHIVGPFQPAKIVTIDVPVETGTFRLHPRGWCMAGEDATDPQVVEALHALIEQINTKKGEHAALRDDIKNLDEQLFAAVEAAEDTSALVSQIDEKEEDDEVVLGQIEHLSVSQAGIAGLVGHPPDADAAIVLLDVTAFEADNASENLRYVRVADEIEESRGWATWLNDDDDNLSGVLDREEETVSEEDDLSQVWWSFAKPLTPPSGMESFHLSIDASAPGLAFWAKGTKGSAPVNPPLVLTGLRERRGVFAEATTVSVADLSEQVSARVTASPDDCEDILYGTAVAISTVTFKRIPALQNSSMFEEASEATGSFAIPTPGTDVIDGGEFRMFPEKFSVLGPTENVTGIKVVIKPPRQDQTVWIRSVDVDDPSSDDPFLDFDGEGSPDSDNRGEVGATKAGRAWFIVSQQSDSKDRVSGMANSQGIAEFSFQVTKRPGDNFRVIAALSKRALVSNVHIGKHDPQAKVYSPANFEAPPPFPPVITIVFPLKDSIDPVASQRKQSPLLTIWRRVHVERDTMVAPAGTENARTGTTQSVLFPFQPGNVARVFLGISLEASDMYEDGLLILPAASYSVLNLAAGNPPAPLPTGFVSSAAGAQNDFVMVTVPVGAALPASGASFALQDDDVDSVLPQFPDFSLMKQLYKPAYILPLADGGSSLTHDNIVPFVRNFDWAADLQQSLQFALNIAQSDADRQEDFWIAYALSAFQPGAQMDFDPDHTGPIAQGGEVADGSKGISITPGAAVADQVSFLFLETIRDRGTNDLGYSLAQIQMLMGVVTGHEIAHQFGLTDEEANDSIMAARQLLGENNDVVPVFSVTQLRLLRNREKSPGR